MNDIITGHIGVRTTVRLVSSAVARAHLASLCAGAAALALALPAGVHAQALVPVDRHAMADVSERLGTGLAIGALPFSSAYGGTDPESGPNAGGHVRRGEITSGSEVRWSDQAEAGSGVASPTTTRRPVWSWDNVMALDAGVRIRVRGHERSDRAVGVVASVSPEAITVDGGDGPQSFLREDVASVEILNPHHTRWVVVGAAVSAGVVAVLQLNSMSQQRYCSVPFGSCETYASSPGFGRTALNMTLAIGAAMPFVRLARHTVTYKSR